MKHLPVCPGTPCLTIQFLVKNALLLTLSATFPDDPISQNFVVKKAVLSFETPVPPRQDPHVRKHSRYELLKQIKSKKKVRDFNDYAHMAQARLSITYAKIESLLKH